MQVAAGRAKILIVDDEPLILEMTSRLLAESGYAVETCHMWPSVANVVRQHEPDLILLDYNMPGLRGDDLCKILKRNMKTGTKIILFSAEPEQDLIAITGECGADGYLKKNEPAMNLLQQIGYILG
jgi:CheY-like chemotaxis protein